MRHELKTWTVPFQAVIEGRKTYEIRRTDDRQFDVDDELYLREWDPQTERYSGRYALVVVRHVTIGGEWGLPPKLCVMGIEPSRKS
jgi:hypothetical protein